MKRLTLTCLLVLSTVVIAMAVTKSQVVVYIDGQRYYIHTVESKETIYSIAKTYGVSEKVITELNTAELKAGQNIKIPYDFTKEEEKPKSLWASKRSFTKHKVERGETLYSISRKYEISIDTIIEDNPTIDPIALPTGYKLLIRKDMKGKSSNEEIEAEWSDYQADLNLTSESDGYRYHIVQRGETLYSLSKQSGLTEAEFIKLNSISGGLKAGSMVKMPIDSSELAAEEQEEIQEQEEIFDVKLRSLRHGEKLKVALLLPLSSNGSVQRQFGDFYRGFQEGLEVVKSKWNRDIELTVYNTERSVDSVANIVASHEFQGTNLIVGPVYEELLPAVLKYAERNNVPVVSPLASLKESRSGVLFQLAPPTNSRLEKVKSMVDNTKHITFIYTQSTDLAFEKSVLEIMGDRPYDSHQYVYEHPTTVAQKLANNRESAGDLSKFINNDKSNTIVILASNETDVDRILSALSSAQINIVARGGKSPVYQVLGNSEWSKYKNIDRTIFFKNNVVMLSSYHAKRDNVEVRRFDSKYIEKYNAMPSLYTYRGFDAAMIFGEGVYSDMDYSLEGRTFTPLHSPYRFTTDQSTGVHTNKEWIKVNYNNDYTITIE